MGVRGWSVMCLLFHTTLLIILWCVPVSYLLLKEHNAKLHEVWVHVVLCRPFYAYTEHIWKCQTFVEWMNEWMKGQKERRIEGGIEKRWVGWSPDVLMFLGEDIYSQLLVSQPVRCGPQSVRLLSIPLTPTRPTPHGSPLWCSKSKGEIPYSLSSGNQTVHVIYCRRTTGMCNAHPHSFITYFLDQTVSQPENA